jgi:hypothetical protein
MKTASHKHELPSSEALKQQYQTLPTETLKLEYTTLRDEILKRIELRQQLISILLTFAAGFLVFGLGTPVVAFVFPPLAALLALAWGQNDFRTRKAAEFIRTKIEPVLGLSWESESQTQRQESGWRWVIFSHGGIFFLAQLMAMVVGAPKFTASPVELVLIMADILAMTHVIWIFRKAA